MNDVIRYTYCASPIGKFLLTSDGEALTALYFPCHQQRHAPQPDWVRDDAGLAEVVRQLQAYFAGKLQTFDVPLRPAGTPFEHRVWNQLRRIPFGTTVAYRDIAQRIGQPTACRAVGLANGRNPIPIIVPCHRVIGANGSLTGFGGGLDTKRWLLEHESVELPAKRKPTRKVQPSARC